MSKLLPLSATELMNYPVLHTTVPHEDASDKYSLISSIDVINDLKAKYNWHVTSVQVAPVKDESRENKQVHCVRLRHFDDLISPKDLVIELLFLTVLTGRNLSIYRLEFLGLDVRIILLLAKHSIVTSFATLVT